MPVTDIGAVANAVSAIATLAQVPLENAEAQKNENLRISLVADWSDALACSDLNRMHAMADRLLTLAGYPVAMGGRPVVVDASYLDQFARVCAAFISQTRQLNQLAAALQRKA